VARVMAAFLRAHSLTMAETEAPKETNDDPVCEEVLLEAFSK